MQDLGLEVRITASVGVASYPTDSKDKSKLLHLADEAMYLVKNTSRDSVAAAGLASCPRTLKAPAPPALPPAARIDTTHTVDEFMLEAFAAVSLASQRAGT